MKDNNVITISVSLYCQFLLVTVVNTAVSTQNVTTFSVKETFRTLCIKPRERELIRMRKIAAMGRWYRE